MINKNDLPEILEFYRIQQEQKKKTRKIILIAVAIFIGIWILIFIAIASNVNNSKSISKPETITDSISASGQTPSNNSDLSKEDQDSKARDAVAILDVYVKHNMNDPDSFDEISYTYSYHVTYFIIELKFRGKNSFGAKVINYIVAKTDLEGNVIKIITDDN